MPRQTAEERRWGVTKFVPDKAGEERLKKALRDYAQSYRDDSNRPIPLICRCHHCQYHSVIKDIPLFAHTALNNA